MNDPTPSAAGLPLDGPAVAAARTAPPRPFYWSVRRELWENRSLYLAPLAVAALVLVANLLAMTGLPRKVRALAAAGGDARPANPFEAIAMAPAPIMLATFLVAIFYCLDALYGERRDRSMLFWKSLPVSDRTTVLAKAAIPLLVLPGIGLALSLATVAVLLVAGTVVLLAAGESAAPLWAHVGRPSEPLIMAYGLAIHALWFAPIYGWLLLASGWARRLPLLWAALPPLVVAAVERAALGTSSVAALLLYRVTGAMAEGFAGPPGGGETGHVEHLSQLSPGRLLASPGLWGGVIFAAACLLAAVRLRRGREPS